MLLSLRQLEIIHAVCRHGSVTAAAAALEVSQPAISMVLRDCTRLTGFPLFRRQQGRLQPTPEMQVLLPDLTRMFEGAERIDRLLGDIRETSVGAVHLAVTPALADSLLPRAVATFQRARPRIALTLRTMDNLGVVEAVTQLRVDFGLVLTPLGEPETKLVPLCTGALVCVVPPGHPLAGRVSVSPADLAPYPLISFSRNLPLGHLVETAFRRAGVPRRIGLEVNQSSVACALVREGAGVAVIDPFLLNSSLDRGVIALPLTPLTNVTAQALISREAKLSRAALLLLATIRQTARAMQGR
ncbi:MAG: LysR substrate-binding domain-containing protein [Acetobacteraceae bacterium]|nr:LysR substrate-binding domain-containing protein [Acetobacteraceae bacterium]